MEQKKFEGKETETGKESGNRKIGRKVRPLVQLLPAVVVAGLVIGTLPGTAPVMADIPERLVLQEEQQEKKEEKKKTEEAAETQAVALEDMAPLPYEDGIYTGSAQGYGGLIKVQVTIKDGHMTDIQILDASGETESFFNRAKTLIDTVLARQTWEVDVVSGATYSSRGILGAIQNALTGEMVKNEAPEKNEPEPIVKEEFTAPAAYKDGVYTGSAQGFGGLITVQVTINGGQITEILIVSADDETPSYLSSAKSVINTMISSQSPNVDTVSGATYSSNGIINAVKRALNQAATDSSGVQEEIPQPGTEENPDTPNVPETPQAPEDPSIRPAEKYKDGTYTGSGEGYGGEVTVAVTVSDGRITDIQVLSAEDETPSFFNKAKAVLTSICAQQTTEVDAVSGATYSSEGLKEAVQNALKQALEGEENTDPAPAPDPGTKPDPAPTPDPGTKPDPAPAPDPGTDPDPTVRKYKDGTYTAVSHCADEEVFSYDVRVTLTIKDDIITEIKTERENDTSESPEDNVRYLEYAMNGRTYKNVWYEGIMNQILQKQSADRIDVVSRATYSSKAIQEAAKNALQQALAEAKLPEEIAGEETKNPDENAKPGEEGTGEISQETEDKENQQDSEAKKDTSEEENTDSQDKGKDTEFPDNPADIPGKETEVEAPENGKEIEDPDKNMEERKDEKNEMTSTSDKVMEEAIG